MNIDECHHSSNRRRLIGWGCGLFGLATVVRISIAAADDKTRIAQPAKPTREEFAKRAFEMRDLAVANGDQGYGALIVNVASLQVVGQSPSRVTTNGDPSAHAEMEAIRDAARRVGRRDLSNHVMYSSSRPCPMCEAAAYWANLDVMYFGQYATDAGSPKLCRNG
ncbi:MAG: nucleoside deaminase [Hyphomicrobiaceae bacterium]